MGRIVNYNRYYNDQFSVKMTLEILSIRIKPGLVVKMAPPCELTAKLEVPTIEVIKII